VAQFWHRHQWSDLPPSPGYVGNTLSSFSSSRDDAPGISEEPHSFSANPIEASSFFWVHTRPPTSFRPVFPFFQHSSVAFFMTTRFSFAGTGNLYHPLLPFFFLNESKWLFFPSSARGGFSANNAVIAAHFSPSQHRYRPLSLLPLDAPVSEVCSFFFDRAPSQKRSRSPFFPRLHATDIYGFSFRRFQLSRPSLGPRLSNPLRLLLLSSFIQFKVRFLPSPCRTVFFSVDGTCPPFFFFPPLKPGGTFFFFQLNQPLLLPWKARLDSSFAFAGISGRPSPKGGGFYGFSFYSTFRNTPLSFLSFL